MGCLRDVVVNGHTVDVAEYANVQDSGEKTWIYWVTHLVGNKVGLTKIMRLPFPAGRPLP